MNNTILIIDDDSRNIFALKAVLEAKGFKIAASSNMKTALDMLDNNDSFAIILIDMMMPEMDGYEGISIIKTMSSLKKLPLIAVTAQAMAGDREKCLAAGADEYISKPIDVDVLLTILNSHIKR